MRKLTWPFNFCTTALMDATLGLINQAKLYYGALQGVLQGASLSAPTRLDPRTAILHRLHTSHSLPSNSLGIHFLPVSPVSGDLESHHSKANTCRPGLGITLLKACFYRILSRDTGLVLPIAVPKLLAPVHRSRVSLLFASANSPRRDLRT